MLAKGKVIMNGLVFHKATFDYADRQLIQNIQSFGLGHQKRRLLPNTDGGGNFLMKIIIMIDLLKNQNGGNNIFG
ncbi:MAG: hypothetical protein EAY75_09450 [Bacteroidetes bacterium]|nr:MAG: hypothetical protein EAY75_09450 [Bacteroidota bacterium]